MTNTPDIAANVVSIGTNDFPDARTADARFAIVDWFARHSAQTFHAAAVANRLPDGADLTRPDVLARALEVIALRSRFVLKDIRRLDPIVFPCVVFQKDGPPLIVTGVDGKTATIVDPSAADMEGDIRLKDLRRRTKPGVLLVTESEDAVNRRLDPDSALPNGAHWFWGAVRANWGAWAQIMLAAF